MIKVTVELIPFGDESLPRELLGEAIIYNDGTGTPTSGNYYAAFGRRGMKLKRPGRGVTTHGWANSWKEARVREFPRKRLLAWDLLYCALVQIGAGERNDDDS